MYINTHCNYSQPASIKLDNENIGGHCYTFTPTQLHKSYCTDCDAYSLALWEWQNKCGLSPVVTAPFSSGQKTWDTPLVNVTRDRLRSAASNQAAKAHLLAATAAYSGAFLNVCPCSLPGTWLDNCMLHIAVSQRLGSTICALHDCSCWQPVICGLTELQSTPAKT